MFHRGMSRGERAASLLTQSGFDARALDGGYPGWKQAGLPVEEAAGVGQESPRGSVSLKRWRSWESELRSTIEGV